MILELIQGLAVAVVAVVAAVAAVVAAAAVRLAGVEPHIAVTSPGLCLRDSHPRFQRRSWAQGAVGYHLALIPEASTVRSSAVPTSGPPASSSPPLASFCPPLLWP